MTLCPGDTVTLPYVLTGAASNVGAVTVSSLDAGLPSGVQAIAGGGFDASGSLTAPVVLQPGQSQTFNLTLTVSGPGSYVLNAFAFSAGGCLSSGSASGTVVLNVVAQPSPVLTQSIVSVSGNQVQIQQTVCPPAGGLTAALPFTLQTFVPACWVLVSGGGSVAGTLLPGGGCIQYNLTLEPQVEPNWCAFDTLLCARVTGTCFLPGGNCLLLPLQALGLPTLISAGTFSAAIAGGQLAPAASSASTVQNVVFLNNIIDDQGFYSFTNSQVRVATGREIRVIDKNRLELSNTHVHAACPNLWHGIVLVPGAVLESRQNTLIEDAFRAVEGSSGIVNGVGTSSQILLTNTTFDRNHVGVYVPPGNYPAGNSVGFLRFDNNLFDCSAPLLPAYPGQPEPSLPAGYAGVELHRQNLLSIPTDPAAINTFRNTANGIVAFRSTLTIRRAVFENMQPRGFAAPLPDGNGIYANGTGSLDVVDVVGFGGFAASPHSFLDCRNGITAIAVDLGVRSNNMLGIHNAGVEALLCEYKLLGVSANNIEAFWAGVRLWHCQTSKTFVTNNTVAVGGLPVPQFASFPLGLAGVAVQSDLSVPGTQLSIDGNTVRFNRARCGISLEAHDGGASADVNKNQIYVEPGALGGNTLLFRRGIALLGCNQVAVRCNDVRRIPPAANPILNSTTSVFVQNSTDCRILCNQTRNTEDGLRISGNCANAKIQGNVFGRHTVGLLYEAAALTGPQIDAGNQWIGPFVGAGAAGARHLGGSVMASASQYSVQWAAPTLPPSFTPSNFFVASTNTPFACNSTCPNPLPLLMPVLTSLDVNTVNGQIPQVPEALPAGLRRHLFGKLDKKTNLFNPATSAFYQTWQPTAVGRLTETADLFASASALSPSDSVLLEQLRQEGQNLIEQAGLADSLFAGGMLNAADRTALHEQWAAAAGQRRAQAAAFEQNRRNQALAGYAQAQNANAAVNASAWSEDNERRFNNLYLDFRSSGTLHPAQGQELVAIANQCPLTGVPAVHRARSLRSLLVDTVFADLCPLPAPQNRTHAECWGDVAFDNPSFEDSVVAWIRTPERWTTCLNTPDTQPVDTASGLPSHGNTYLGMGTILTYWQEAVGQPLTVPLEQGKFYKFSLDASYLWDPDYIIPTEHYTFSIWFGDSLCNQKQWVYVSEGTFSTYEWQTRTVSFVADQAWSHVYIATDPGQGVPGEYFNIDNLRPVPCDSSSMIADVDTVRLGDQPDLETVEELISGTEGLEQSDYFAAYPNPVGGGEVRLAWGLPRSGGLVLAYDAVGRLVLEAAVPEGAFGLTLDVSALPSGVYTLMLQSRGLPTGRAKLAVVRP